jgi:hypothetical protein
MPVLHLRLMRPGQTVHALAFSGADCDIWEIPVCPCARRIARFTSLGADPYSTNSYAPMS